MEIKHIRNHKRLTERQGAQLHQIVLVFNISISPSKLFQSCEKNNEKMCFLETSPCYQLSNLTFIVVLQVLWNAFQPRG